MEGVFIMKKLFLLFSITSILFIGVVYIPYAHSATKVSVSDTSGMPASAVDVTINVDDATGIAGGDITLTYSLSVLTAKSVEKTTLTSDFTLVSNLILGQVKISMASATGIAQGSGAIIKIAFEVNAAATSGSTSLLTLEPVSLYNEAADIIPVTTQNGTFTVEAMPKIGSVATVDLVTGINMFAAPLNDPRVARLSDLISLIGPEVTMIISYDTVAKKFVSHLATFPETSPTNVAIRGSAAYIVMMTAAKSVTFQGLPWSGETSLSTGINLIAIPVNPGPWRLSDLAKFIGPQVAMIISYDTVAKKFVSHLATFPDNSPTNVEVKGGVGYIVMMTAAKNVTFTGESW
jgi:hypothetical protein